MRKLLTILMLVAGITAIAGCNTTSERYVPPDGPMEEPGTATSTLLVRNQSETTIFYLYVSPSSSSVWGPDLLGSNVLSPGYTATVNDVPCGRTYDLKVEGSGHTVLATRYDAYVACGETMTWTLTGG